MPPEQLADTLTCKPAACLGCGQALDGIDATPCRQQAGWAGRLGARLRADLEAGRKCDSTKTRGTCRHLLGGPKHLWRFLSGDGTEPTNNRAERGLRHAVLWRKSSGGTVSKLGGLFVCRLLSVVATCRQQGWSVLTYLTSCFEAKWRPQPVPSLLGS